MAEVNLELESTSEAPGISRSHLAKLRRVLEPRFDDVALVISELVSNSVRHSGNGRVRISVVTSPEKVRLEVTDHGPCFDSGERRGDGLGLSIVDKIADAWGVEAGGRCTVWVELGLSRASGGG